MADEFITLVDIANNSDSATSMIIAEQIIQRNPVIARMPFMSLNGNMRFDWDIEGKLPTIFPRALGSVVDESKATSEQGSIHLKPQASLFSLDKRLKGIKTRQGQQAWEFQIKQHAKAMGFHLSDMLINGDSAINPKEPNGAKAWNNAYFDATNNPGVRFKYDDANNTNGLQITDSQTLVDNMEILQNALLTSTTEFWCDQALLVGFSGLLLQGANTTLANKFRMVNFKISDKVTVRIGMWDEIPMFPMFTKGDGVTKIIDFNETTGSSDFTTSLWAVSIGQDLGFSGLMQDKQGPFVDRTLGVPFGEQWEQDFPINFISKHPQAIARMTGILAF